MHFEIATSIKYGNYKYLRSAADGIHELIKDHWRSLCRSFDFNRDVRFLIRPITGCTFGTACGISNTVEIDPRATPRNVLLTIVHELVHMEQYKQDRLLNDVKNNRALWYGIPFPRSKNYEEYFSSPWEIEARNRSEKYLKRIWPE